MRRRKKQSGREEEGEKRMDRNEKVSQIESGRLRQKHQNRIKLENI